MALRLHRTIQSNFSKISALMFLGLALASPAMAGDNAAHMTLSMSEMDFSTEQGLESSLAKIDQAAWTVCSQVKPAGSRERDFMSDCQRRTTRRTVEQINDDRLTAFYGESTQLKIVGRAAKFIDRFRQ